MILTSRERLLYGLRHLYSRFGYRPFRMSKFEKYELYARNRDFLVSDRVITFYEAGGELMALKPDVTLSIVRSASYRPGRKEKFSYQETVYRPAGNARQFREIMQCGLECIGDLDSYDEYEVMRLAERSLLMTEMPCVLSFSHLGIMNCLMDALHADESERLTLRKLLAARSEHELSGMFSSKAWPEALLKDLKTLLSIAAGPSELPARLADFGWLAEDVRDELKALSILYHGQDTAAVFDFSVSGDLHYYNGLVFQGFVRGISEKVLSGGRYDRLLERMERPGSAVGFAVYFSLLEQLGNDAEEYDADVLLLYDSATPLTVLRDRVQALTDEGRSVLAQRTPGGRVRITEDLRGGAVDA